MKEVRFTKKDPAACPSYKEYYIKDRMAGKDVHGHDAFEYALFRRRHFELVKKFRKRKQAYKYVCEACCVSKLGAERGDWNIVRGTDYIGVYTSRGMYKVMKRSSEVLFRPYDDEQMSGWAVTYNECLTAAKIIVSAAEQNETPRQYSLWEVGT